MTRRDRIMATLKGESIDRPAVSFYELNGLDEDPDFDDPYNIYNDPSWRPLIELTRERTDHIVMRGVGPNLEEVLGIRAVETVVETETGRYIKVLIQGNHCEFVSEKRHDKAVHTVWVTKHFLETPQDMQDYLDLKQPALPPVIDLETLLDTERRIGHSGVMMLDIPDPLGCVASLFEMGQYTINALTEPVLFHQLLELYAEAIYRRVELIGKALPGRLWRIYGPEYASPPYLPPSLFEEYVCRYVTPMIEIIHRHEGYVRIHSHGNLKAILPLIASMEPDALDPIEPPPLGDVTLSFVRQQYGRNMVLFGNLEITDIENMPTNRFREKVVQALDEGTSGSGRGFVLMPSASPYGRRLSAQAMVNYEVIIDTVYSMFGS
tara:strand:- start:227 stop:1363 length:1137 start_codon:yes stop_codon:yes gene_type:complete